MHPKPAGVCLANLKTLAINSTMKSTMHTPKACRCVTGQSNVNNHQPSTINHQPSTINHQPSTINHQPSITTIFFDRERLHTARTQGMKVCDWPIWGSQSEAF
jgi:hypothetical protein